MATSRCGALWSADESRVAMKRLSADRRARRGSGQQRAARIDFKDNNSRSEAAGGLAHSRARLHQGSPPRLSIRRRRHRARRSGRVAHRRSPTAFPERTARPRRDLVDWRIRIPSDGGHARAPRDGRVRRVHVPRERDVGGEQEDGQASPRPLLRHAHPGARHLRHPQDPAAPARGSHASVALGNLRRVAQDRVRVGGSPGLKSPRAHPSQPRDPHRLPHRHAHRRHLRRSRVRQAFPAARDCVHRRHPRRVCLLRVVRRAVRRRGLRVGDSVLVRHGGLHAVRQALVLRAQGPEHLG